jgi:hypothetical protein
LHASLILVPFAQFMLECSEKDRTFRQYREVYVMLPRTRHLVCFCTLLCPPISQLSAQAVSFVPSYSRVGVPTPAQPITSLSAASSRSTAVTIYDDAAVLSRLGRIASFGTPSFASSATTPATISAAPAASLAATQANVDPFYGTSLNPITNATHFLQPTAPAAASASVVAHATTSQVSVNSSLLPRPANNAGGITSTAATLRFAGLGALLSTTPIHVSTSVGGLPIGSLVGVPEPSTLVLLGASMLMIGYGWLRQRWKAQAALALERQIERETVVLGQDLDVAV